MSWFHKIPTALVMLLITGVGNAQSLRCNGGGVREGDSKLMLMRQCGQPTLSDQFCSREWVVRPPRLRYGDPGGEFVCVPIEELLYEREQGDLPAYVRIREGKIVSIRFGNGR